MGDRNVRLSLNKEMKLRLHLASLNDVTINFTTQTEQKKNRSVPHFQGNGKKTTKKQAKPAV